MINVASGWDLNVDVSAEWIFVRLHHDPHTADHSPQIAERVWAIAEQYNVFRIVMELDDGLLLTSHLVGQVVLLHKRLHRHGGVLRLCGLAAGNAQVLEVMRLTARFPNYRTRENAVLGRAD